MITPILGHSVANYYFQVPGVGRTFWLGWPRYISKNAESKYVFFWSKTINIAFSYINSSLLHLNYPAPNLDLWLFITRLWQILFQVLLVKCGFFTLPSVPHANKAKSNCQHTNKRNVIFHPSQETLLLRETELILSTVAPDIHTDNIFLCRNPLCWLSYQ